VAIVWIWRAAIMLTPVVYRVCQSTGCDANSYANTAARWDSILNDVTADPAEISAGMSADIGAPEGGVIVVTDFTGTFELRKLQWRLSRAPASRVEDVDVMTFHFLKTSGGAPVAWNDATDLATIETALGTLTTGLKAYWPAFVHSDQFRWYADGPAFYTIPADDWHAIPVGDNPALRITEVDVAGTASVAAGCLPPQCALTVTEKTSSRRHWGRFYLPMLSTAALDGTGLLASAAQNALATLVQTFYNSCRSSGLTPVVWSIQKGARPKRPSGTLPAQPAKAYEITSLQIDDIFDIIRSRRYRAGITKSQIALT
jgi:hypothetical protein